MKKPIQKNYLDIFQSYSRMAAHGRKAKSAQEQALSQVLIDSDIAPDLNMQASQKTHPEHRQKVALEFAALRSAI